MCKRIARFFVFLTVTLCSLQGLRADDTAVSARPSFSLDIAGRAAACRSFLLTELGLAPEHADIEIAGEDQLTPANHFERLGVLGMSPFARINVVSWVDSSGDIITPTLAINFLPSQLKYLRNKFSPDLVNEVLTKVKTFASFRLANQIASPGAVLGYKLWRISRELNSDQLDSLDQRLAEINDRTNEMIRLSFPEVYEALMTLEPKGVRWVTAGYGPSELEAVIATKLGGRVLNRYMEDGLHLKAAGLYEETQALILELQAWMVQNEAYYWMVEGSKKAFTKAFYSMLRDAETRAELKASLEELDPSVSEEIINKTWKLRSALKVFTPPPVFDSSSVVQIEHARQLERIVVPPEAKVFLRVDLKSVGARLLKEVGQQISEGQVIDQLTTSETSEYVNTFIDQIIQRVKASSGQKYLTHFATGDEVVFWLSEDVNIFPLLEEFSMAARFSKGFMHDSSSLLLEEDEQGILGDIAEKSVKLLEKEKVYGDEIYAVAQIDASTLALSLVAPNVEPEDQSKLSSAVKSSLLRKLSREFPAFFDQYDIRLEVLFLESPENH